MTTLGKKVLFTFCNNVKRFGRMNCCFAAGAVEPSGSAFFRLVLRRFLLGLFSFSFSGLTWFSTLAGFSCWTTGGASVRSVLTSIRMLVIGDIAKVQCYLAFYRHQSLNRKHRLPSNWPTRWSKESGSHLQYPIEFLHR